MSKTKSVKKKVAVRMTMLAAKVLGDVAFFTGAGMEKEMAGKDYFLDDDAREYWLHKHAVSIAKTLKNGHSDWDQDRMLVTPRATDLGKFAAQFAIRDSGGANPVQVTLAHAKAASKKVNEDTRCRAGRVKFANRAGSGGYCEG